MEPTKGRGLPVCEHAARSGGSRRYADRFMYDLTYATRFQLTLTKQSQPYCLTPNPEPYPLPNPYLLLLSIHKSTGKWRQTHTLPLLTMKSQR